MSVLEAKRGLSHPRGCCSRQPPGPPWGAQGLLESTPSARFPFGAVPPLRGRLRGAASPSPCSPPGLSLEDQRPGPVPPTRLLSRSAGLLRPFSLRSGTGLPAPRPALPCFPRRPLLRAPVRSFPLETSSALGPPASSLLQTRPSPCSAPACGTLTPAGEESQHTNRQETTVTVLFLQGQVIYCQKGGVGM